MNKKLLLIGIMLVLFMVSSSQPGLSEDFKSPEEMFKEKKYTEEKYYKTERMLLSATKYLMDSKTAPAINSVITAEEIRNMGARNLFDVLDKIPGVSTSWNQIKGLINIRGVQTDHSEKVLLMLDGVTLRDSYTGSPTYFYGDDLMVENVKRIEVIRGPGSALYGANAFIGVINIITMDPEDYKDGHGMASASYGSFNTRQYTLLFAQNKREFKISGHLNYLDTDGERPIIEEDALSNHPTYNTSASLAPGPAQTFNEKIDAGLKIKFKNMALNGRIFDKERGSYAGVLGALNDDSRFEFSTYMLDLNFHGHVSDDLTLFTKCYFVHHDADTYAEAYPEGYSGGNDVGLIGEPMWKNNVIGGELSANYTLGDHLITPGIVYENDRHYDVISINNFGNIFSAPVDTSETSNYNKNVTREIWAGYLQDMWEITAYDSLTLGVRYDHYNDFGGTTNPRAGYVHEFENEMVLKLLYGKAFRAPNNNELYSINNPAVVGNANLLPETIETYEASFEIPFLRYFNFNVSLFHNVIGDIIRLDTSQTAPYPFTNAAGDSTIKGIETELKFNFDENRYGYVNASYQNSEDDQGVNLPYVSKWMGNAGYNHEFFNMLNTNINVHWIGERTRLSGDTRDMAPSATLVDATFILKNFYKKFELKGSVFNLFDNDFVAPSTITSVAKDLPLHRRMFLVELLYRF